MKKNIFPILWQSITEGGFFSGIIAATLQYLNFSNNDTAIYFIISFLLLSITIFNIRLFYINKKEKPLFKLIEGHDNIFDNITPYVKNAKNSIWATRFSKGSPSDEHEYHLWTMRRIIGNGCKAIYSYRRLMSVDSKEKALFISELIKNAGKTNNLYIKKAKVSFPFDLLIIDSNVAFLLFHESGSTGTIEAGLEINNLQMVNRLKEIYESAWRNNANCSIKRGILSDEEIEKIISLYKEQAARTL